MKLKLVFLFCLFFVFFSVWAQEDLNLKLINASAYGDLELVRSLSSQLSGVNGTDGQGDGALHWASSEGNPEVVEYLVSQGADLSLKNQDGNTALHMATMNGQHEIVRYLVAQGADIHEKNIDGESALDLVVQYGHAKTLGVLFRNPSYVKGIQTATSLLADEATNKNVNANRNRADKQGDRGKTEGKKKGTKDAKGSREKPNANRQGTNTNGHRANSNGNGAYAKAFGTVADGIDDLKEQNPKVSNSRASQTESLNKDEGSKPSRVSRRSNQVIREKLKLKPRDSCQKKFQQNTN